MAELYLIGAKPSVKWRYYLRRYGLIHASVALAGRKLPLLWKIAGRSVTRPYLRRWIENANEDQILNLGGGSRIRPEWLSADINPAADVFMDVERALPLPNSSVNAIFLEEVIEHVPYDSARRLLVECNRVLKPGRPVRITTPDLDWFIRQKQSNAAIPNGFVREQSDRMLRGTANGSSTLHVAALNSVFFSHGHRFIYDRTTLAEQIESAGFVDLRFGSYQEQTLLGRFDSHAHRFNHPPEMSLYGEATKACV